MPRFQTLKRLQRPPFLEPYKFKRHPLYFTPSYTLDICYTISLSGNFYIIIAICYFQFQHTCNHGDFNCWFSLAIIATTMSARGNFCRGHAILGQRSRGHKASPPTHGHGHVGGEGGAWHSCWGSGGITPGKFFFNFTSEILRSVALRERKDAGWLRSMWLELQWAWIQSFHGLTFVN